MVALLELGVLIGQALHIRKGGIQVVFGSLGFILRLAYHVPRLFLPGFGSSGTVLLGFDLGHGFLILLVGRDVAGLYLLHQLCRGAGLCHGVQQLQRLHIKNGLAFNLDIAEPFAICTMLSPVSRLMPTTSHHLPQVPFLLFAHRSWACLAA